MKESSLLYIAIIVASCSIILAVGSSSYFIPKYTNLAEEKTRLEACDKFGKEIVELGYVMQAISHTKYQSIFDKWDDLADLWIEYCL